MKKVMILLAVSFLVCGLALAGGKGAVNKIDMVVHTDSGTPEMPAGTVIGSANLNTTADNFLIVVVNLDDAVVPEDNPATLDVDEGIYDSLVWINGVKIDGQIAVDCLKINAKGQGTANYKVDLGALPAGLIPDGATEINVSVVVRPSFSPNTTPCYVNGPAWQTDIPVPLKK